MADEISTKLKVKALGDGLYQFGGDLICTYPLLGTTISENLVKFEYEKYYVTVSWTNSGDNERKNPKWERVYK